MVSRKPPLRPPHDVLGAHAVAAAAGKWLMLASIVAAAVWFNRRRDKPPLTLQLGLAAAVFLFLTPGFGAQYLCRLAPWVIFLGLRASILYYVVGGLYLSVSYSLLHLPRRAALLLCRKSRVVARAPLLGVRPHLAHLLRAALAPAHPP
ncbi:MAG: hypothetical protein LC803_08095 [Acidobacteria bacterium]|nr:hypothetical protein [Acidobacteriota bacterium]